MNGYNALAARIGTYPSLAVFRRFLILHSRDLLCMQAEIVNLQQQLLPAIEVDREVKDPLRNAFEYDIAALKGPHTTKRAGLQWSLTLELRAKLKEYGRFFSLSPFSYRLPFSPSGTGWTDTWACKVLWFSLGEAQLRFAALCRLAPADKNTLATLQELLQKPCGSGLPFLKPHESGTWDEEYISDMASLTGQNIDRDGLSKLIEKLVRSVYHPWMGHKVHDPLSVAEEAWACEGDLGPVIYYPDNYVTAAADALSTILASVLPACCAFGLFFIRSPLTRMVAIVACTVASSVVLTLVARPRRVESFCAASAFVAVLVVFGGSGTSNDSPASPSP
ncbi:hypothetical protein ABEF95_008378 [Exophiala dermatitidis]